jgi:hypothetical protein
LFLTGDAAGLRLPKFSIVNSLQLFYKVTLYGLEHTFLDISNAIDNTNRGLKSTGIIAVVGVEQSGTTLRLFVGQIELDLIT